MPRPPTVFHSLASVDGTRRFQVHNYLHGTHLTFYLSPLTALSFNLQLCSSYKYTGSYHPHHRSQSRSPSNRTANPSSHEIPTTESPAMCPALPGLLLFALGFFATNDLAALVGPITPSSPCQTDKECENNWIVSWMPRNGVAI
jgi:hypothetical protein